MSSLNVFLLALSIGLSIALYQKSRADPKESARHTSTAAKKSNKKKKSKAQAQAQAHLALPKTQYEDEKQNQKQVQEQVQEQDKQVEQPVEHSTSTKKIKTKANAKQPNAKAKDKPNGVSEPKSVNEEHTQSESQQTTNESIRAKHNVISAALHSHLDDMRDEEVDPTPKYSHVARIPAPEPAGPRAVQLTAADIEDGWESVGTRERSKSKGTPSSNSNSFATVASTNPFSALEAKPVSSSWVPAKGSGTKNSSKASTLPSVPTKKQRQNAAKTAAKRATKEAEEQERLDRLARHRREQEREKLRQAAPKAPTPFTVKKATPARSSGPRASINERGTLVWE